MVRVATGKADSSRNDSPQPKTDNGLRPLDYLQAAHEAVQALGVSSEIAAHFGYRIYDAMIVAAALEANCTILYTEDLQNGQKIGALTIRNPFAIR